MTSKRRRRDARVDRVLSKTGKSDAVTFTFKYEEHGRRRRIVFEERLDASGTSLLVVTHLEGEFSSEELDNAYGDALAKWLHPNEPPPEWFE
jgi:hypothetical protein